MKKILFVAFAIGLILFDPSSAQADADAWKRGGHCRFWFKRFRTWGDAESKTYYNSPQYLCKENRRDGGCQWAYSEARCFGDKPFAIGIANWSTISTSTGRRVWWETAGPKINFLGKPNGIYLPDEEQKESPSEANASAETVEIGSDVVKLKNLEGSLSISKNEIETSHGAISVRVFTVDGEDLLQDPSNEELAQMTPEQITELEARIEKPTEAQINILSESKIVFINGKLYLSGIFNEKNVNLTESSNELLFSFNFDSEIIFKGRTSPEGIYFGLSSDVGDTRTGNPKEKFNLDKECVEASLANLNIAPTSQLTVRIIGNPTKTNEIRYSIKSLVDKQVDIKIFDLSGNIKYSRNSELLKSETEYDFNEKFDSPFTPGIYLLKVSDGLTTKNISFLVE